MPSLPAIDCSGCARRNSRRARLAPSLYIGPRGAALCLPTIGVTGPPAPAGPLLSPRTVLQAVPATPQRGRQRAHCCPFRGSSDALVP